MCSSYWKSLCKVFKIDYDEFIKPQYDTIIENEKKLHGFYFYNNINYNCQSMSIIISMDINNLNITEIHVYFKEMDQNGNHILSYENIFKKYTKKSLYAIFDLLENYFKVE